MEAFFFGYQAFTAKPDEMLARRGLSRVHHRILFFIARYPGLSVKELRGYLGVSKQALNTPLRQLQEMSMVESVAASDTTGAGDAFNGALAAALARAPQEPFIAHVRYANRFAALSTERPGAAVAMPRHAEVLERFPG